MTLLQPTRFAEGLVDGAGGVHIYWQAWLPADDPVSIVVVHHGIGEHSGRYPHAVRYLVAAGYGVYALDARGHGRSDGRRASLDRFEQLVVDFGRVLDQVVGPAHEAPTYLLGYSLGGAVALSYALEHQDELAGAIVIGSALGRGAGISRLQFGMASVLSTVAPRFPSIRLRAADMTQDPEVARVYDADPLVHHGRFDARILGEVAMVMRHLPQEFRRLRLPLLLLHGAADITANPAGSQGLYDGVRSADKTLKLYPGKRHDVLNEPGHEEVMSDIVAWLDDHRREPTSSGEGQ